MIGCLSRYLAGIDVAAIDESFATEVINPRRIIGVAVGCKLGRPAQAVEVASQKTLQAAEDRAEQSSFRRGSRVRRWRVDRAQFLLARLRTRARFAFQQPQQPIVDSSVGEHSRISLEFAHRMPRTPAQSPVHWSWIITESGEPPLNFRDPTFGGLADRGVSVIPRR